MSIARQRKEYTRGQLHRRDLDPNPIPQFLRWLNEATQAGLLEPTAMTLATADEEGRPSARIVLLKGADERGFSFFTNYRSRKGSELAVNPNAALVFFWRELERQICIAGTVSKLTREEADAYFRSRPRGSRLGALASDQASVIETRSVLERRLRELETLYPGDEIPLPEQWGGYVLAPSEMQFWQGRPNRLHDRFLYTRRGDDGWAIERLAP